jgi:hypothetical protein
MKLWKQEINYVGIKENCLMRNLAVSEFCKETWKQLCKRSWRRGTKMNVRIEGFCKCGLKWYMILHCSGNIVACDEAYVSNTKQLNFWGILMINE